ncbi:MAG: crosslink repair DNA glycosylase YcaQ family protein [Acidobacteriota bacterium]
MSVSIDHRRARRLALARAGLLKPRWTGLPHRAAGRGGRARRAAHAVVERFGYLQLDTVAVAGARSHALVLASRLEGVDASIGEDLLLPGAPLFEFWGHEVCWMPLDLYPAFAFRRRHLRTEAVWTGRLLAERRAEADDLLRAVREHGPIRSLDLKGRGGGGGWWDHKPSKHLANALWSIGELAIAERRAFQRLYDLPERVLPETVRTVEMPLDDALERLILRALDGHGWASPRTLAETWRLRNLRSRISAALQRLEERGAVIACRLDGEDPVDGWIRPDDLELAERLASVRPRRDRGVLLSPFDPVLWDRARVARLFDFDMVLEIFKPAAERRWGYFCLPVLAGERLVARVDLKADRRGRRFEVRRLHFEQARPTAADRAAVTSALERHGHAVGLTPAESPEQTVHRVG